MNDNFLKDEVKEKISCLDYLKQAKNRPFYCCPFCLSGTGKNQTGAVTYYPETNDFYCHSCGRKGDVLDLIQIEYKLTLPEAISYGAKQLHIDGKNKPNKKISAMDAALYQNNKKTSKTDDFRPSNNAENFDFTEYYEKCSEALQNTSAAMQYLKGRSLTDETITRFKLGYDNETRRIVIPACKSFYQGRAIDQNEEKRYLPKAGTKRALFNAEVLEGKDPVFVLEGAIDAMSIEQCGGKAIAMYGAANYKLVTDYACCHEVKVPLIICYDADENEATRAKTNGLAKALQTELEGLNVKSIIFNLAEYTNEGEKDINDILRNDAERLKGIIRVAEQEAYMDYLKDIFEKLQGNTYKPFSIGLNFFDDLLNGGVVKQSLMLLLAAPAAGKTTLCMQLAEELAMQKTPVLYLNFEMSKEQMLAKAISYKLSKKGLDYSFMDILQGYKWNEQQKQDIETAFKEYSVSSYPYIKYNPDNIGSDLKKLLAYLTQIGEIAKESNQPAPIVIVDYLHLISSNAGIDDKELIKQAVTGLKKYAIDYNTFVISIVATNRDSNKNGRITMESGRDSSNIEYTADYMVSLNYDDLDNGTVNPDDLEGIKELQEEKYRRMIFRVLKNRFNISGKTARVYFDAAHNMFLDTQGFIPNGAFMFHDVPAEAEYKKNRKR